MRNQLPCVVDGIDTASDGDPAVLVRLRTAGGAPLGASVTRESADLLGLVSGVSVLVMCKAMAVRIQPVHLAAQRRASAVPCVLPGRVDRVAPGGQRDEVVLALAGGGQWVGFAERLCVLVPGDAAQAFMPPEALVIGLAG